MKNHTKVGNRQGKPAYRTPSSFLFRACLKAQKVRSKKIKKKNE